MTETRESLAGSWIGRYAYPGGIVVAFEAELTQTGHALSGRITEPNTFRPGGGAELAAEISGWAEAGRLGFVKCYLDFSQGDDPRYAGQVTVSGNRIEGTWRFSRMPGFRGVFTMSRAPLAAARVLQMAAIRESV